MCSGVAGQVGRAHDLAGSVDRISVIKVGAEDLSKSVRTPASQRKPWKGGMPNTGSGVFEISDCPVTTPESFRAPGNVWLPPRLPTSAQFAVLPEVPVCASVAERVFSDNLV
jgi:hypothetical protein